MTFVLDIPFSAALASVRRAVLESELSIPAEIDAAQRVKRALQMYVSPCRVLLIDNPAFMLETTTAGGAAAVFIPAHVVVSGAGTRTLVHMLDAEHIRCSDLPITVRAPVLDLHRQLVRSLARVAGRARPGPEPLDRIGDPTGAPEPA